MKPRDALGPGGWEAEGVPPDVPEGIDAATLSAAWLQRELTRHLTYAGAKASELGELVGITRQSGADLLNGVTTWSLPHLMALLARWPAALAAVPNGPEELVPAWLAARLDGWTPGQPLPSVAPEPSLRGLPWRVARFCAEWADARQHLLNEQVVFGACVLPTCLQLVSPGSVTVDQAVSPGMPTADLVLALINGETAVWLCIASERALHDYEAREDETASLRAALVAAAHASTPRALVLVAGLEAVMASRSPWQDLINAAEQVQTEVQASRAADSAVSAGIFDVAITVLARSATAAWTAALVDVHKAGPQEA